jgi:hypothetical protein
MNYEKNCLPIFEPLFKLKAKKKDKTTKLSNKTLMSEFKNVSQIETHYNFINTVVKTLLYYF